MNKTVNIGKKTIGDGYPCFIIAEAGSNHDGNFSQALKLVDIAVEAKADAVKFQTFKASKMYPKSASKLNYIATKESIYEVVKKMEMPAFWIPKLAAYCNKKKIIFISTPCDEESVDRLNPYVPAFKVASYELTHFPLLKHIAQKNKPIILSTGASNIQEVKKIVSFLDKNKVKNLILMQCTASYPTKLQDLNIRVISYFKKIFKIPIGLSDHSREFDIAPLVAVSVGANVIEKHFTISNSLTGPDHKFAIEPLELKLMIKKIRQAELALGYCHKVILDSEKYLRDFARRSIYAIKNINIGDKFSPSNIAVLRRGGSKSGISPALYEKLIGRKAKRKINKFEPILSKDLNYEKN